MFGWHWHPPRLSKKLNIPNKGNYIAIIISILYICYITKENVSSPPERMEPSMSALEELIEHLENFTPEQLDKFLQDPVTLSILQPEEAFEPYPQVAS